MLPQEIIRKKRNHQKLSSSEIDFFIRGVTNGTIVDAQTAALTMAVFLNGMDTEETAALTMAMRDSGDVLSWPELDGPVVDKHSSGGVGDKVSLMLAPMLAACGAYVPMISGRGLGHTGGTLDKFDSIPGYQTSPSILNILIGWPNAEIIWQEMISLWRILPLPLSSLSLTIWATFLGKDIKMLKFGILK